jgi:N-carbamoyl-L-amino-acid hydrolase
MTPRIIGLLAVAFGLGFPAPAAIGREFRVDQNRLWSRLEELSKIGATAEGGVDRVAFTDADRKAREHVRGLMRSLGLAVRVDAAGNIIGRLAGAKPEAKPILIGSHLDTVPNGGKYDGALGVMAALECVQVLAESHFVPSHPLEVVVFSDEEGGSVGSRAMAGELDPKDLAAPSQSSKTIGEGIAFLGGDPVRIGTASRRGDGIAAYLELHIEQGGRLEAGRIQIGIVEGIVGIRRWTVTVEGAANHAGTTPMDARSDALLAAARFIVAAHGLIREAPGPQVGNVGRIKAEPGAPNVIPGRVELTLELRDLDDDRLRGLFERIAAEAARLGFASKTVFSFAEIGPPSMPSIADERLRGLLSEAAAALGYSWRAMPSGAGHDAQNMARLGPMAMIFIPSRGGISHSPKEYSSPEDSARGANVLLNGLLAIDRDDRRLP